jgi:formiminotetrahydrofolate cyclodeaminase
MSNETLEEFLESVAARTPTPGGGAVAAVTGAQAAALMSMVSAFSSKSEEMHRINQMADTARSQFTELAQQDMDAFKNLMSAFKLKKEDATRQASVQLALTKAAEAPRSMMLLANSLIAYACILSENGNSNLATDTAMVALLLDATISSAELNVLINLKNIKNQSYIDEVNLDIAACRLNLTNLRRIAENIRGSLEPGKS